MPAPRRADIGRVPVKSTEFASHVVDSLESGLLAVDADARIVLLNRPAAEILRLDAATRHSWIGSDFQDCLADHRSIADLLARMLEGHEGPGRAELVLAGDESLPTRVVGFTLQTVRDDRGKAIGASLLFRDLTPFERAGEQERLHDRLAALGAMAAGMAHEIRNPLAGMEVLTGLLRRRLAGGDPESVDILQELTGEMRTLARVVDTSLDYVKSKCPAREVCDPVNLLEASLERALKRMDFAGSIERDFAEVPQDFLADPDQLQVVFTDLILNALHAMPDDSLEAPRLRLEIFMRRAPGEGSPRRFDANAHPTSDQDPPANDRSEIVFCVQDNGPGVPPELRDRIFYPFFTTREEGSGVGLATAQKLVTAHAGILRLESPAKGGSRFEVSIPTSLPPEAELA